MEILDARFLGTVTTIVSGHYMGTVIDKDLMLQKPNENATVLQETFEPSEKAKWIEKVRAQFGSTLFLVDATPK